MDWEASGGGALCTASARLGDRNQPKSAPSSSSSSSSSSSRPSMSAASPSVVVPLPSVAASEISCDARSLAISSNTVAISYRLVLGLNRDQRPKCWCRYWCRVFRLCLSLGPNVKRFGSVSRPKYWCRSRF